MAANYIKFDTNKLPEKFKEFYNVQFDILEQNIRGLSSITKGHLPKITPVYLKQRNLDAFVIPSENSQEIYIYISAAIPSLINLYFNNLLKTSSFLHSISNSEEKPLKTFDKGLITTISEKRDLYEEIPRIWMESCPNDSKRKEAAWELTRLSMAFVCNHELSHIELGHSKSIAILKMGFLSEIFDKWKLNIRERNIRRVWEYEADMIGVMGTIEFATNPYLKKFYCNLFNFEPNHCNYDIIGLVCSSIFAVFHLLNEIKNKGNIHPDPLIRFGSIIDFMSSYCLSSLVEMNLDEIELRKTLFNAAYNTYNSWAELNLNLKYNLENKEFWFNKFKEFDKLEKLRLKNYNFYYKNAFNYPFAKNNTF